MVDRFAPASDTGERAARVLRDLRNDVDVRAGVRLGALTVAVLWGVTFAVGLIPVAILQVTLLGPMGHGSPFGYRWWAVWSLLGHFGGTAALTLGAGVSFLSLGGGSVNINLTALLPLAILVGIMAWVGKYARPNLPDQLKARFTVLVAASVSIAVVAAVVALFGGYTAGSTTLAGSGSSAVVSAGVSFGVLSTLVRSFALTLVIGAFTLGVVQSLPVPQAAAVKLAVRFAVVPALIGALIASLVVGIYGGRLADATGEGSAAAGPTIAVIGTLISPAVGAAAVPMALGTQATVGVSGANLALLGKAEGVASGLTGIPSIISSGDVTSALMSFSGGRIFKYAGYMGVMGKLGALVVIVAVLAFWWSSIGKFFAVMGASSGRSGFLRGAYLGLLAAVAVGLVALLLTIHVNIGASSLGQGMALDLAVGITGLSYIYLLLALVVSGGVLGYVQAALHPSAERYALPDVTHLVHRVKAAVPPQYQAAARDLQSRALARPLAMAAAAATRRYCSRCGAPFSDAATSFCEQCGAPRPLPPVHPATQRAGELEPAAASPPPTSAHTVSPQPSAPASFCTNCGAQHKDAASKFCRRCGTPRQL
jgi:hypothetical protein